MTLICVSGIPSVPAIPERIANGPCVDAQTVIFPDESALATET